MKTIVFTGGGTAGHVMPNMAIIPKLQRQGWRAAYIGSAAGIERELIGQLEDVPYYAISTGKLRRYVDIRNMRDPFRVLRGIGQAYRLLGKLRPNIVFSKGGFVAVPVTIAAWLRRIPVIVHESDMTPGLANKISLPLASKICVTFPETLSHVPPGKAVLTGSPIRDQLYRGNAQKARLQCGFVKDKPVLLVMGGSLGSQKINEALRADLSRLLQRYQIIHICGKGNRDNRLAAARGYRQFEFVGEELPDMLALADIAVSRAGANAIFELLALRIPMLLIPLSLAASRGDQLMNARSFERQGYSRVLYEEQLSPEALYNAIGALYDDREQAAERLAGSPISDSIEKIVELIQTESRY